jgi:hypothetical protein
MPEDSMPTRIIREGIITSEAINSLSEGAENFYRRLMSVADDYGRYYSHHSILRANCFPLKLDSVSESNVKQWLSECVSKNVISLYGDGGKYLQIHKFGQQTRSKSKFPEPDKKTLIKCKSLDNQMSSLVGVGDVVGCVVESEVACVAKTMNVGIPEEFTKFVYADWASRSGKDAGGVLVSFLPYVTKRWAREQNEWKNGKHKGSASTPKRAGGNF